MSLVEKDWEIDNKFNKQEWIVNGTSASFVSDNMVATISFDVDRFRYLIEAKDKVTGRYRSRVPSSSYNEVKKQFIKFLANSTTRLGVPSKDAFWNLVTRKDV